MVIWTFRITAAGAILKQAAPCLILLDEVVAYARNLEGIPYDGFVSFLQSLTEAANAVPGVLVVGLGVISSCNGHST